MKGDGEKQPVLLSEREREEGGFYRLSAKKAEVTNSSESDRSKADDKGKIKINIGTRSELQLFDPKKREKNPEPVIVHAFDIKVPGMENTTFLEICNMSREEMLNLHVPGQNTTWREFLNLNKETESPIKEQKNKQESEGNDSPSIARLAKQNSANGGLGK